MTADRRPIIAVLDHVEVPDTNGRHVEMTRVDLGPCPRCGAVLWFVADTWPTRGIVYCGDCNHHAPWREVAES